MRRLTTTLAASGIAALALTGAGTAAKPVVSASLSACVDPQGAIMASVTWEGGRVTNGTFVAYDNEQAVPNSIVQWQLPHGERTGSTTSSLGPDLGFDVIAATLYAGQKEVAIRHLDVAAVTSC